MPDATYTVHQLFQALFLVSGNDAASALANAAGGVPQTVAAMTATAKSLGALDTTVRNPSGLDAPGQYTSAYDLAVFARAAMARQDFRDYVTTVKAQFPGKMPKPGKVRKTFEIFTQDRLLLNYRGAIGVKTGWTTKARGTFVGAATRGGHTLVATVMHSDLDSWRDSAALLSWGFHNVALARPVGTLDATSQPGAQGSSGGSVAGPPAHARTAAMAATHPRWRPALVARRAGRCWSCAGAAAGPGAAAPPEPAAVGHDARPGASVARAAPGEDAGQPGTQRRAHQRPAHGEGPARRPRNHRVHPHRHRVVAGSAAPSAARWRSRPRRTPAASRRG